MKLPKFEKVSVPDGLPLGVGDIVNQINIYWNLLTQEQQTTIYNLLAVLMNGILPPPYYAQAWQGMLPCIMIDHTLLSELGEELLAAQDWTGSPSTYPNYYTELDGWITTYVRSYNSGLGVYPRLHRTKKDGYACFGIGQTTSGDAGAKRNDASFAVTPGETLLVTVEHIYAYVWGSGAFAQIDLVWNDGSYTTLWSGTSASNDNLVDEQVTVPAGKTSGRLGMSAKNPASGNTWYLVFNRYSIRRLTE